MMNLKEQILTLIISFFYGVLLYFILKELFRIKYFHKRKIQISISFFLSVFFSIMYFILLLYINHGVIHLYFFLAVLFGFLISYHFLHK